MKLITEFATRSSTVDVFMTRPLQEAKMFYKNGWNEPLTNYDFSEYPKNALDAVTFSLVMGLPAAYSIERRGNGPSCRWFCPSPPREL
jgi:hypothetical protein